MYLVLCNSVMIGAGPLGLAGLSHFSHQAPLNWQDSVVSAPRYPGDSPPMTGTGESLTESRRLGLTFLDCFGFVFRTEKSIYAKKRVQYASLSGFPGFSF